METREKILKAAIRLFSVHGVDGVSMRAVAARVGVTPMALYRHFNDKEALIDALVSDALDAWAARVKAVKAPRALDWIHRVNDCFLDFALNEPRRFEAAFLLSSRSARRFPNDFAAGRSPVAQMMVPKIEEAMAGRRVEGASALEIWFTIWALTQGLITLHRAGRFAGDEKEFRALYRRATQRCLQSFMTDEKK